LDQERENRTTRGSVVEPADRDAHLPETSDASVSPSDTQSRGADAPPAGEASAADSVDALKRERDDVYDRLLRKTAEFDNYRKRVDRERREQAEMASADVLRALLPVVDDFERALQAGSGSDVDTYRKGIELIHRKLVDLLHKHGVRPIDAVGKRFDPHVHEAVAHEDSPGRNDGEIIEEYQRGYTLGDRLLRPAMVKVAKS
jgi:molecular chaperone GrpE